MKRNKDLLIKELGDGNQILSHFDKGMYKQIAITRKQITAIAKILEECKQ